MAWIHRRGRNLEGVASALRTAWKDQPGASAPDEIRFLRRFSNYLTPKLGWLGADTWTVIAIYLRNVLLNLTALAVALAGILLLPRWLGWLLSYLPTKGSAFIFSLLIFFFLLLVAAVFVHRNLQFFRESQAKMWTADPLSAEDEKVLKLNVPDETAPAQTWIREKDLEDFVLGFDFTISEPAGEAEVVLRGRSLTNGEEVWESLIIQIGGKDEEGRDRTGEIVGREKATGATLAAPGQANRMQILYAHDTCRVRLNSRVVNVLRGAQLPAGEREIAVIRREPEDKPPGVRFTDIRLRKLSAVSPSYVRQGRVQWLIVVPLFAAGLLTVKILPVSLGPGIAAWLPGFVASHPWLLWGPIAGVITVIVHLTDILWKKGQTREKQEKEKSPWLRMCISVFAMTAGAWLGGAVLAWMQSLLPPTVDEARYWARLVWMPAAFIVAVSLTLTFYIGLCGRALSEEIREWWSRLGAWFLIYTVFWIALLGAAFYSPPLLEWLAAKMRIGFAALGVGWVLTTIMSLVAARSPQTGRQSRSRWLEMLVAIGPYVFIAGLVALVSWGIDWGLKPEAAPGEPARAENVSVGVRVGGRDLTPVSVTVATPRLTSPDLGENLKQHWQALNTLHLRQHEWASKNWLMVGFLVGGGLVVWLLSRRVDVNDFSMHAMYRNRLARCYLGASNTGLRHPHIFTGFDRNDDIPLQDLDQPMWRKEQAGPYPIINCSLNLVGGDELAWQDRKAAAFTFTPKYCGYDFPELPPGFRSTASSKEPQRSAYAGSRGALTLATAMAISGAAASPNMGYHTSPAPAFLMTLFNVRLGWWIGNPRSEKGWKDSSPNSAFPWLLAEMFGLTHAEGRYIYLSDGGHFENLGIFELVRRRCRFIVACDAEEDHDFEFGGLGNAIEKCRTDLGIDIELEVEPIRQRDAEGRSRRHCAVGRIRYDKADPEAPAGTLLYIKSSVTGDENTDVLRYAARHPAFPHESTGDQWFGESQFESYRALGHHAVMSALLAVDAPEKLAGLTTERLFVELAQRWYAPAAPLDPAFARRGETLNALYETLRTEPKLRFLSRQIYPEWRVLMEGRKGAPEFSPAPGPWVPEDYEDLMAGLYFCNRMIQLMEDVYHDLHLEREYAHPDNRGWINLFKHWSWSRMFRVAWTVSAANSGARFQNFCERILGLEVGQVIVREESRSIAELASDAAHSPLTSVEKELVQLLCRTPGTTGTFSLCLIEISTGEPESKSPTFPVGIILLRTPDEPDAAPQIAYFRVRDHLRRMGLARRGLYQLLKNNMEERGSSPNGKLIGLNLFPPSAAPPGIENNASRRLFRDLYNGVRLELQGVPPDGEGTRPV